MDGPHRRSSPTGCRWSCRNRRHRGAIWRLPLPPTPATQRGSCPGLTRTARDCSPSWSRTADTTVLPLIHGQRHSTRGSSGSRNSTSGSPSPSPPAALAARARPVADPALPQRGLAHLPRPPAPDGPVTSPTAESRLIWLEWWTDLLLGLVFWAHATTMMGLFTAGVSRGRSLQGARAGGRHPLPTGHQPLVHPARRHRHGLSSSTGCRFHHCEPWRPTGCNAAASTLLAILGRSAPGSRLLIPIKACCWWSCL